MTYPTSPFPLEFFLKTYTVAITVKTARPHAAKAIRPADTMNWLATVVLYQEYTYGTHIKVDAHNTILTSLNCLTT